MHSLDTVPLFVERGEEDRRIGREALPSSVTGTEPKNRSTEKVPPDDISDIAPV